MAKIRESHNMFEAIEKYDEWDEDTDFTMGASRTRPPLLPPTKLYSLTGLLAAEVAVVENKAKVTEDQLRTFLELCWVRYVRARIEPGKQASNPLYTLCSPTSP
jgi:DNA-directed RNA polymerase III subunit RPC1